MFKLWLVVLGGLMVYPVLAQDDFPGSEIYDNTGAQIDLSLTYRNEKGDSVSLGELLDKPTVVSFVYYNCPGICTPLLSGEIDVFNRLNMVPGRDYKALTLSFNELEGPELAREKKANYFKSLANGFPEDQWSWLTGDSRRIRKFTDAVGFKFIPAGQDFYHPAALIVLSPEGKVVRYIKGTNFDELTLRLALIEAGGGATLTDSFLKYSFHYDPEAQGYTPHMWRIILLASFLFTAVFITVGRVWEKRNKTANQ